MRNTLFSAWIAALIAALPAAAEYPWEEAKLLASNTVVATYEQTVDRPCMHLTSLCPDRCGHADKLAVFRVVTNEKYSHSGQYGDEKAEPGSVLYISVLKDPESQDPAVRQLVSELKPGDQVRFTVDHYYVRSGNGQYPVRPVSHIERVSSTTTGQAGPEPTPSPAPAPRVAPAAAPSAS